MIKKKIALVLSLVLVALSFSTTNLLAADEYVYGRLSYLTYGEYFTSELGDAAAVASGDYDTITSATTAKYKSFVNSAYSTDESTGLTSIYGISNVPVRISKSVYDSAFAGNNSAVAALLDRGFTPCDELSVYKDINEDGSIGAYVGLNDNIVAANNTSSISTDSVWGNYILYIYSNDGSALASGKEIEGAYVTTTEGKSYPLYHSANLWFQAYEFSWVVEPDFKEPHGNSPYTKSLTGLTGKTITSVTYIYKTSDESGNAVFNKSTYNVGELKVKDLLDENSSATASNASVVNGNVSNVSLNVPVDANYNFASINGLENGTDYSVVKTDQGFDVDFADSVKPGKYSITLTDDKYEDINVDAIVLADVADGDITIENNRLSIKDNKFDVNDVLAAVKNASLTINGTPISYGASVLFNEDASVNLDAKTSGRGSKVLFGTDGSYEVTLDVPGYGTISGVVVKGATAGDEATGENIDKSDDSVNGEVAAETAVVAAAGNSNVSDSKTNTFDGLNYAIYIVLALASISVLTTVVIRRKRA